VLTEIEFFSVLENGNVYFKKQNDSTLYRLNEDYFSSEESGQLNHDYIYKLNYIKNDSILSFKGLWKNDSIQIKLNKFDTSKILLTNRGFHWINEYPYNR
jgi:hypothetical protein